MVLRNGKMMRLEKETGAAEESKLLAQLLR